MLLIIQDEGILVSSTPGHQVVHREKKLQVKFGQRLKIDDEFYTWHNVYIIDKPATLREFEICVGSHEFLGDHRHSCLLPPTRVPNELGDPKTQRDRVLWCAKYTPFRFDSTPKPIHPIWLLNFQTIMWRLHLTVASVSHLLYHRY